MVKWTALCQLPITTDAIQAAGWCWRGVIPWEKGLGARAGNCGLHRAQCEYIVYGTKGVSKGKGHGGPWPGFYSFPVLQKDKHHVCGKPTPLMEELVKIVPAGATILDPFAGSHTTGVACIRQGRNYIGIEQSPEYHHIGLQRLTDAATERGASCTS